ncbi:MAG TPA: C-GCAxxG-C-C family protein [Spirochaetota bacterium]|nr:C-GCAxxG-C-C family protein [Spirochaetota bacterium]
MDKTEAAVQTFGAGFNCAQAVLGAFAPDAGLDADTAYAIATGFGAGLAYRGETCGAVSGAVMVLGLRYGWRGGDIAESRDRTVERVREFIRRFEGTHGTILCQDLLGMDVADPAALCKARERNLFRTLCPRYVRDAAAILEDMLGAP